MKTLFLIPARAGSKRLPGKNIKLLGGKPLVSHSISFALDNLMKGDELCISTDDRNVYSIATKTHKKPPFLRPEHLASDDASTYDVIMHALEYNKDLNLFFDRVLLLQPTSPFRIKSDIDEIFSKYDQETEMVVSVRNSKENLFTTLFEENEKGYITNLMKKYNTKKKVVSKVYELNGSMYLIRVDALKGKNLSQFTKIKKVVMPDERSVDIDTPEDWKLAELYCIYNNSK